MSKSRTILTILFLAVLLSSTAISPNSLAKSKKILSKCPIVTVSCPTIEQPYTFTAALYDTETKNIIDEPNLEYRWSLSSGKIASGESTATITIDKASTSTNYVTAMVDVRGLAPECKTKASCTTPIP